MVLLHVTQQWQTMQFNDDSVGILVAAGREECTLAVLE